MRSILGLVIILSTFSSCTSHNEQASPAAVPPSDTTKFFEITQYIKGQIEEVNRVPYYIYMVQTVDGKRDSSAADNKLFNQLAAQFLSPDISQANLKPHYKEAVFEDQTTESYTINYSTTDKSLPIQSIDVLIGPDGKTVKRLFIRKSLNYSDSSAIEQLSWKPGESFMIHRSVILPGDKVTERETNIVWNEKLKEEK